MATTVPQDYTAVLNAIGDYYGVGSDQWVGFSKYGLAYQDIDNILDAVPGVKVYQNNAGQITGYSYSNPFSYTDGGIAGEINSNVQQAAQANGNTFTANIPASGTIDQSGNAALSSGAKSVSSGLTVATVLDKVSLGIAGVNLGCKLGAWIDSRIYNAMPDFWDEVAPTINPQTWDSIASTQAGKAFVNALFGINKNTGETQMYLPEDVVSYLAYMMKDQGFFATGGGSVPSSNPLNVNPFTYASDSITVVNQQGETWTATAAGAKFLLSSVYGDNQAPYLIWVAATTSIAVAMSKNGVAQGNSRTRFTYWTNEGKTVAVSTVPTPANTTLFTNVAVLTPITSTSEKCGWLAVYGDYDTPAQEGVSKQDGATFPDTNTWTSQAATDTSLRSQFPDMYSDAIYTDVPQKDGTTTRIKYVPVNTTGTKGSNDTTPTNTTTTYNQTTVNQNSDETLLKTIIRYLTGTQSETKTDTPQPPDTPNPTDTGTGDTPTIVMPTGQASALWSVYNPSQAELNSFGAWLWSSNFIDQILKLFNNPMQSIIGVHKIFATPATSGAGNITVGYLDSGVSANLVSNQYTDINCGTVNVREQFGNVFDYTDTHIRLYLPFIGIVDLDTADVMRSSVSVIYHVDVITGACLAEVKVSRDASGGTLYQFAGDAAVRYPISSGSYMGVVAGIASAIGGVASAVMTGGATLPLAAGAVAGGISGAHTQVQHSGNFSGNAGAMGGKKPYIIIERPQSYIADNFKHWQGLGANTRRAVAQMSGYFKFSDVHTESISKAAESEIEAIRAALESGVIA